MNEISGLDQPYNVLTANGKKVVTHTAWRYTASAMLKINAIRQRYWDFSPLSEEHLYKF